MTRMTWKERIDKARELAEELSERAETNDVEEQVREIVRLLTMSHVVKKERN